jgi:hypothetical protein
VFPIETGAVVIDETGALRDFLGAVFFIGFFLGEILTGLLTLIGFLPGAIGTLVSGREGLNGESRANEPAMTDVPKATALVAATVAAVGIVEGAAPKGTVSNKLISSQTSAVSTSVGANSRASAAAAAASAASKKKNSSINPSASNSAASKSMKARMLLLVWDPLTNGDCSPLGANAQPCSLLAFILASQMTLAG